MEISLFLGVPILRHFRVVICSHPGKGKTLSYSRINKVLVCSELQIRKHFEDIFESLQDYQDDRRDT